MNLLLDTHVLLWWFADDRHLKRAERAVIADPNNLVYVSGATVWEIAIKKSLGRLEIDAELLAQEMDAGGMLELPVRWKHAGALAGLPQHHDDPFDRLLIAQALNEGLALVSYDRVFRKYTLPLIPS